MKYGGYMYLTGFRGSSCFVTNFCVRDFSANITGMQTKLGVVIPPCKGGHASLVCTYGYLNILPKMDFPASTESVPILHAYTLVGGASSNGAGG